MGRLLAKKSTAVQNRDDFLIELSFELGVPLSEIEQWPQSVIARYEDFARRKLLPNRRLQFMLAQIPFYQMLSTGHYKGLKLQDFMLQPISNVPEEDDEIEDDDDSDNPLLILYQKDKKHEDQTTT